MTETWKPIPGMEWYEVSDLGSVRRVAHPVRGRMVPIDPIPYIPRPNRAGYLCVSRVLLNRAVLLAFRGPPTFGKTDASHLDGDKLNNRLSNLAWESRRDNLLRKRDHGTDRRGAKSHLARLTEKSAAQILAAARSGEPLRDIAHRFGVDASAVSRIKSGHRWSHLQG